MADTYTQTGRQFGPTSTLAALEDSYYLAKQGAERERRQDATERHDAYNDDFADVLRARIDATYTQANAEELVKVIDTTNNPLKRIVNEVSVLYSRQPVRKLATSEATIAWRDVLHRANASVVFPRLDCLTNLLNTTLLYVRPCRDSLTLKLILPQDCTVWPDPDDPTMPLAVEFRECDPSAPNAKPIYHQWDRREGSAGYRQYDTQGKLVKAKSLPNPYKDHTGRAIIPILAFHREWPTWSFWDSTSGADLYELCLMVGMWETWINHLIRTDSAMQKYASGLLETAGEQQGGPTSILQFRSPDGQPVSVGQFSSQADWNGLGAQIKRKLENVLYNYGLVLPDTRTSGDPTSGFALTVRSQGLTKLQKRRVPSYEKSEETLYRVVAAVHNFERNNPAFDIEGPELPPMPEAKPTVQFGDVETTRTVEEMRAEMDLDEREIAMGLASPVSVYVKRHPEATEAEALAAIEQNRKLAQDESAEEVDPSTALNGAQVASLLEVVKSVARKEMPRETGVEIIVASFPVDRETAERLMGPTGATFFVEKQEPLAAFGAPKPGEKQEEGDEEAPIE